MFKFEYSFALYLRLTTGMLLTVTIAFNAHPEFIDEKISRATKLSVNQSAFGTIKPIR